jgi:hypothetical protein
MPNLRTKFLTVPREVVLPRLDVVLGLATRAIKPLVELLGAAALKVGDDQAGVGSGTVRNFVRG